MENNPVQPNGPADDFWGEPISVYTDAQALADGVLADIGRSVYFQGLPVNRMTSNLFEDLKPFAEADAPAFDGDFRGALASILRAKFKLARASEGNTGEIGDIYTLPPNLWLVRNEVGGWTAMYPSDY